MKYHSYVYIINFHVLWLLHEVSIKLKSQKKYINLKFSNLYDIIDRYMFYYVYFYFSVHACKFYEFLLCKTT